MFSLGSLSVLICFCFSRVLCSEVSEVGVMLLLENFIVCIIELIVLVVLDELNVLV